ncbi:MAG: SDR family oxidoreductase [Actinomycetota bacterium]|nr:SDR family oxidoreductase [Actinomycetota bacterium]
MTDEVGLLLGASGGIGRACLDKLVHLTPRVLAVARSEQGLPPASERILGCAADLGTEEGRDAIVARIAEAAMPIRYVVVASGVPYRAALSSATAADWDYVVRNNLSGPALLLGRLLKERWTQPAAVIIIGSLAARRALPNRSLYGAVKAGLEHFARSAAVELASRRITVNVVSAGIVDTPFLGTEIAPLRAFAETRVPLGRIAQPSEIAHLVTYLVAAPEYLTGAVIPIDGGAGVLG